jgi:hypothetical protein
MSINTKIYIGIYIKLQDHNIEIDPYDEEYDDYLNNYQIEEMSIVHDHIGDSHTYFGITLHEFEELYNAQEFTITDLPYLSELIGKVKSHAMILFGIDDYNTFSPQLKIFINHS